MRASPLRSMFVGGPDFAARPVEPRPRDLVQAYPHSTTTGIVGPERPDSAAVFRTGKPPGFVRNKRTRAGEARYAAPRPALRQCPAGEPPAGHCCIENGGGMPGPPGNAGPGARGGGIGPRPRGGGSAERRRSQNPSLPFTTPPSLRLSIRRSQKRRTAHRPAYRPKNTRPEGIADFLRPCVLRPACVGGLHDLA